MKFPKFNLYKAAALFYVIILGVLIVFGDKGILAYKNLKEDELALKQQIKELENKKQFLVEKIKLLKTDKKYYEGVAREKLGMVKRGETVYEISIDE